MATWANMRAASLLLLALCQSGDLAVLKVTSPISIRTPDPYPDGLNLIYDIEAPDGKVIGFVIKELDIRTSENGTCGKGADNLRLGRVTRRWTLDILAEICGQDVPAAPICTNSPRAYMRFMTQLSTDPSERGHRGFNLDIVFMDSGPLWFDGVCGISKYPDAGELQDLPAPRIVGGIVARDGEFPWQVFLDGIRNNGRYFCGGSIINERWIVTAAHCVPNTTTSVSIRAGSNNKFTGGVVHQAELWERHPTAILLDPLYRNDLALVKLRTPLEMTDDIRPICAPVPQTDYSHRKAVISGFGLLNGIINTRTSLLHYATVNITTREECLPYFTQVDIFESEVCVSDNRNSTLRNSCRGDSGGPLAVKEDCGFVLLGASSFGRTICLTAPSVYVSTQFFVDWITDSISSN